jgi:hypothetical protein
MKLNTLIIKRRNLVIGWAIFCIFIAIFLLRSILWAPGLPYTRDLIFPHNISSTFSHQISSWNDIHSQRNLEINKIPIFLIFKEGSDLLGSEKLVKLFFIIVLFSVGFVIFASLFILFKDIIKSNIALIAVCGIPSLLYLFNPWVVDRISNHVFMVFGMALNPLMIVMYVKVLEKGGNFFRYLLLAIILTFISMLSTHNIFYIIPIIIFIGLFYLIFSPIKKRILLSTGSFFLIYLLINSYWILPIVHQSLQATISPSYGFSIEEIDRLSKINTPANIFRFIGGGAWDPILQYPPGAALSIYFSFLISLFSFFAVFLSPKNIFVVLLGVLFCILFLLSLGTNSPIPIYQWLFTTGFSGILWIYRDPSRLIQYLILVCCFLLSFTLYRLTSSATPTLKTAKLTLVYIIMASILVSPSMLTFLNEGGNRLVSVKLPSQYREVVDFLSHDTEEYKVLWLPLRQYHLYDWSKIPGEVAADVYSASSPKPTYGLSTQSGANNTRLLQYIYNDLLLEYRTDEIGRFLNLYEIKYLIVHTDLIGSHLHHAERILQILAHQKDLKLVKQVGPYHIFENLHYGGDSKKFFTHPQDNQKELTSLPLLNNITKNIAIKDLYRWDQSENSYLSLRKTSNETLVKWESTFNYNETESGVKINLNNTTDIEAFDNFKIKAFPESNGSGQRLEVVLYTNSSKFSFLPRNLELGKWNEELFDIRNAKIVAANMGQDLNLKNVTAIGMNILDGGRGTGSLYIKDISLNSDSIYSQYDPVEIIKKWPGREVHNVLLRILKETPSQHILKITSSEPYVLGFSEPYDPGWVVRYEKNGISSEHKSIPLFSAINGFFINKTGEHEIELIHKPAELHSIGSIISSITLFFSFGYLLRQRFVLRGTKSQKWDKKGVTWAK